MSNYLIHYGILGQKWGIRKYQNPDGSLTSAGRARYQKELERSDKKMSDSWNKTIRSDDDKARKTASKAAKAEEKLSKAKYGTKKYDRLSLKAEDAERRNAKAQSNKQRDRALKNLDLNEAEEHTIANIKNSRSYERGQKFMNKVLYDKNLLTIPITAPIAVTVKTGKAAYDLLTGNLLKEAVSGGMRSSLRKGQSINSSYVTANDYDIYRNMEHSDPTNYLIHFGLLGMKWGIRRYQNKDGTLTEEGKLRYGQPNSEVAKQMAADYGYKINNDGIKKPNKNGSYEPASKNDVNALMSKTMSKEASYKLYQQYAKDQANNHQNASKALVSTDMATRNASNTLTEIKKAMNKNNTSTSYRYRGKDVSSYSDEELNKVINRFRLEDTYNSLTTTNRENISAGKKAANNIIDNLTPTLNVLGGVAATAASVAAIISSIYRIKTGGVPNVGAASSGTTIPRVYGTIMP